MAFLRKAGSILGRSVSNHISNDVSLSNPSIFQAARLMSSSKVFVGGLSFSTNDEGLKEAFSKYGEVLDARVIVDRDSGRSKGFGFVTYSSPEEASASIQAMDQKQFQGRPVRVDYANDRARGGFGGGGGYNSYGSGGGGGYNNYGSGGGGGYNDYGSGGGGGGGYNNYSSGGGGGGGGYNNSNNGGYRGGSDSYGSANSGYDGGNVNYGGNQQNFGGSDVFGDKTNNNVAGGDERFGEDDSYAADRRN